MKASTHISSVGVDVAASERDCAAVYVDATSVLPNNQAVSKSDHSIGAMGLGKVVCLVASCGTHVRRCVRVDLARLECHSGTVDVDATSTLPNKGGTSVKASTPSGRWGGFIV